MYTPDLFFTVKPKESCLVVLLLTPNLRLLGLDYPLGIRFPRACGTNESARHFTHV